MFRKLLVANRGEVAARVLATCRRLGIQCVAVASAADKDLAWLEGADEVVILGGARAAQSYLDQDAILEAAQAAGATAIHPGWGFLAENAIFAARCEAAGLAFVGPPAALIRRLGDKVQARNTMGSLGVPLIPGSDGPLDDLAQARVVAERIGYPVLLKASAGGGGRGMRRAMSPDQLESAWNEASGEAQAAFGNPELYLEKLIVGGRHIEFQVLVDAFGTGIALGERECSIQRRHQKLVEETPSPAVTREDSAAMGERCAQALAALGYRNAATVEMLRDADGQLYFMEVNTRLQVEHAITEAVTGVDLVEHQLRIAANQRLDLVVEASGHAIEVRINAEDPEAGFRPCPGRVTRLELPEGEGIRVDTHLRSGDAVSPHYDSMICKLIASGPTRAEAIARLDAALADLTIDGVVTTGALHRRILASPAFASGDYDTTTLDQLLEA